MFTDRLVYSDLIAVIVVFLLLHESFFPNHGGLLLLCLLGLLFLLFLHIISQLTEGKFGRMLTNRRDTLIFSCCSLRHLEGLEDPLEEDEVGVVDLRLLRDVLDIHL